MERFIEIKGAYNVRDVGGYLTQNGGIIKWKKLYRSGKISNIQASENDQMAGMKLKTICDFRTLAEQEAAPDHWYNLENIKAYPFPIGEGRLDRLGWMKQAAMGTGKSSYLYEANQRYVLEHAQRFRAFFEVLLDEDNYPLLYHCTAGKDRTGFATMLLFSALGVDHDTIIEDYLLTNEYLNKYFWKEMEASSAKNGFDIEKIRPILIADKDYLQGAFDAIHEHYGSVHYYLEKEINLGPEEISKLERLLVTYE